MLVPGSNCIGQTLQKKLEGLRDAVVWLRSKGNEKVQISWRDWYAGDSTINYIYFQSPNGKLIDKIKINYGDKKGSKYYQLPVQAGDYRIEFPGYFFRKGSVSVNDNMPMVFEPAKGHASYHTNGTPLYFSVPSDTKEFALCGKFQNGPNKIQIFTPDNTFHNELQLSKETETLHFDCLYVKSPDSGIWHIRFIDKGKIAFWLDGIGNYFALNKNELFVPLLQPGKVTITAKELIIKPMGIIGTHAVNRKSDAKLIEAIRYMKIRSFNRYVDHSWREPFNPIFPESGDNADPFSIDLTGFQWDDQRLIFYQEAFDASFSLIFDSRNSWLGMPDTKKKQQEYAEFVYAYLQHTYNKTNIKWFSVWDEPNLAKFSYEQYESLLKTVAERIKSSDSPKHIQDLPLLAISSAGFDISVTGTGDIGKHWAKRIYATHDKLVDGIGFDYWNIRDLIELWRFDSAVSQAREIFVSHDSDENIDEDIVINQTSISSGGSSSAYDVNSHFGALWLAGAICNAFKSGYLDAFYYFPMLDDPHHKKGLVFFETSPSKIIQRKINLKYDVKPIGESMAMINRHLLEQTIVSHSDSLEVDALITIDKNLQNISIIVVNKFPRVTNIEIDLALPEAMLKKIYTMQTERFGVDENKSIVIDESQVISINHRLLLNKKLAGESIYAISLKAHMD